MGCIQPDGLLTRCGETMLLAMWNPATAEAVAKECRLPLFRARSAIREFLEARLLEKQGERYFMTAKGVEKLEG
jgi:hypothetical protein